MRNKQIFQGVLWLLIYLLLVLAPVLVLFIAPHPVGREFWRELSVSLGFVGLALMALQFALTARFKWLKSPYGADIVYHFHRQISFIALALILAHPLLLFIFDPETLKLLLVWSAPWRARAAVTAVFALLAVIALSVWRRRLKIEYRRWRVWHAILAMSAVAFAMVHMLLVNHYIDLPWKRVLWIAYGVFWIGLLAYTRLIKPWALMRNPYQVTKLIPERGNAWTVVLKPLGKYFTFHPGQFAWLTLWDSPFADSEHPFSISSSAEDYSQLSFTIKALGDFTSQIGSLIPGDIAFVDGPYGSFTCDRHPHATSFLFIAGGVGITPMMSMLRTLKDRNDPRPITLIYANKDWDQIMFRDELDEMQKSPSLQVVHVLDKPPEDWNGSTGFITKELLSQHLAEATTKNVVEIFVCGPIPMMTAVEKHLDDLKVWPGDVHSERFDFV